MNIYRLLKQYAHVPEECKLMILFILHVLRRRYIGVYIDPVLGCNYHCLMCYYSNDEIRRTRHGRMTEQQIDNVGRALFSRVLKLQIGCGAEPTINMAGTMQLVRLGTKYGVPYISMTSNGVLLTYDKLQELVEAGLDELTVSLHGVRKETYERLMGNSKYEAFMELLQTIKRIKTRYPKFTIRINYTMNADNVDELSDFDTVFADVPIDVLQLRPIRNLGDSKYQNFDLTHVSECLDSVIRPLAERCKKKGILVLFPEQINIDRFEKRKTTPYKEQVVSNFVYYNITAQSYATQNIHFDTEDYAGYCRRVHLGRQILKAFFSTKESQPTTLSNPLNYDIQ